MIYSLKYFQFLTYFWRPLVTHSKKPTVQTWYIVWVRPSCGYPSTFLHGILSKMHFSGQGRSRPPPSPKSAPAKPMGPHQRPVRLAYGIHGAQYQQNQQKTPENPSPFYRQKETHSGCGSTFSGERTSRRLFSRMLPNHVVPKIERNLIPPCTPTQTEDGFILCPCQHVEIACQTISSELLSIHKKKKREEEDKDRKSVAEEEQQTDFEEANNECMWAP